MLSEVVKRLLENLSEATIQKCYYVMAAGSFCMSFFTSAFIYPNPFSERVLLACLSGSFAILIALIPFIFKLFFERNKDE